MTTLNDVRVGNRFKFPGDDKTYMLLSSQKGDIQLQHRSTGLMHWCPSMLIEYYEEGTDPDPKKSKQYATHDCGDRRFEFPDVELL